MSPVSKVDQEQVTAAIAAGRSAARGDDITAAEETLRLTATDPVAPSVTSGAMRKKRGVKPGVPDVLVWYLGSSISIELKSRRGQCSPSQRAVREALLRAGAQWWVCRSANAAMWALAQSGVAIRTSGDRERRITGSRMQRRRLLTRRQRVTTPRAVTLPHRILSHRKRTFLPPPARAG